MTSDTPASGLGPGEPGIGEPAPITTNDPTTSARSGAMRLMRGMLRRPDGRDGPDGPQASRCSRMRAASARPDAGHRGDLLHAGCP